MDCHELDHEWWLREWFYGFYAQMTLECSWSQWQGKVEEMMIAAQEVLDEKQIKV